MKKYYALLMAAVLLISLAAGAAYAKYVTQEKLEGTVTITANLGTITLQEHLAVRQSNGSYKLNMTANPVTSNTYILLPGLDVPKDPYVTIENKTRIDCYVYLTLVTNIKTDHQDATTDVDTTDDHNISYTLTKYWKELSQSTSSDGVTTIVYVYTADGTNPAVVDEGFGTNGTGTIPVLAGDMIYVSQKLNAPEGGVYMNFTASMYQVASGSDAEDVYNKNK